MNSPSGAVPPADPTDNVGLIDPDPAHNPTPDPTQNYKYQAFISYRHIEPDQTIAAKLHQAIETFPVPKSFYIDGAKPNFRVFRDREELTTRELSDSIEDALRTSRYLIVLCSKRTPLSPWCVKEVETFIELHGAERVIPVLVEGEPAEAFPRPLMELKKIVTNEEGESIELDQELLAAELRPPSVQRSDFPGYEALEKANDPRLRDLAKEAVNLLNTEKYRIVATMLGVSYGDLKQRDKERRTRRLLQLTGVAAALLIVFGVFMFDAYRRTNAARLVAQETNSAMLLNAAEDLGRTGDRQRALLVAGRAMAQATDEMPLYQQMKARHFNILSENLYQEDFAYQSTIQTDNRFTFNAIDREERYVAAGLGFNSVGIWELATGELVRTLEGFRSQVKHLAYSPDGRFLMAGAFDNQVKVWNTADYSEVVTLAFEGLVFLNRFSEDGSQAQILIEEGGQFRCVFIDPESWETTHEIFLPGNMTRISFHPDGHELYAIFSNETDGGLWAYDARTGEKIHSFSRFLPNETPTESFERFNNCVIDSDGRYLYGISDKHIYRYDLETREADYRIASQSFQDLRPLVLAKDNGVLYTDDGFGLMEIRTSDGQMLRSTVVGGNIGDLAVGPEGQVVILTEDGKVTAFQGNKLLTYQLDAGGDVPEFVDLGPKGDYAILQSLTSQNFRIARLGGRNRAEDIRAQLITVSQNRKFALFYTATGSYIWDVEGRKRALELPESLSLGQSIYFGSTREMSLSNDGEKLLRFVDYEVPADNEAGYSYYSMLEAVDIPSGEILWSEKREGSIPYFSFVGADLFFVQDRRGDSRFITLSGEEQTLSGSRSWQVSAVFSPNADYFAQNFTEGNFQIRRRSDGEIVHSGTGTILDLAVDEGKLVARGVYMQDAFVWEEGGETAYHSLTSARDVIEGTTTLNDYDPTSGLLLTIENSEEGKEAVLIDFASGELLMRMPIAIQDKIARGFLTEGGKELYLAKNDAYAQIHANNLEYEMEALGITEHFQLLDYDTLVRDAADFNAGRELTEAELGELGLKK